MKANEGRRGALALPKRLRPIEPVVAEEVLEPVPWPATRGDDWGPDEHMRQCARSETVVEPAKPQDTTPPKVDVGAIINSALRAAGLLK
jgi:hypothetical protein